VVHAGTATTSPWGTFVCFKFGPGATQYSFIIPITLTNSFYFPTFMATLARLFNFFYVHKAVLIYEPRSATTTELGFVMAAVNDPEWFESHALAPGGVAAPTEAALVTLMGSCTSNTWSPCTVQARPDSKQKLYTAGTSDVTDLNFASEPAAEIRQAVSSTFAIASSNISVQTADRLLGDVYLDLDVEFCEMSLALTTPIAFTGKRWGKPESNDEKVSPGEGVKVDCSTCVDKRIDDIEDGVLVRASPPSTSLGSLTSRLMNSRVTPRSTSNK